MRSRGMARVEHEADRGMVGAAHRLPGIAVVVDVPAPGQRLEGDPHAAAGGAVTQLTQVGGGAVDAAQAVGRDVGADHQEIAVERLHDVELALGAGQRALAQGRRHALEIAERLEGDGSQPVIFDHAADVGGGPVE
jgi:hypothetical protein